MERTTALLIAIPSSSCWPAVLLFATARRRDTGEAIGALARETRKRDRGARRRARRRRAPRPPARRSSGPPPSSAARRRTALATVGATAPVAWVPPDPEALDVTRRQFLNRGIVTFFGLGLAGFGRPCLALPVAAARRRVRLRDHDRQHRRRRRRRSTTGTASPTTPRVACGSPTTRPTRAAEADHGVLRRRARRAWRRASSRSTRSACTSAAVCRSASPRSGSSASATARSTTASVRRRAGPRPAGSIASRRRSPAARHRGHGRSSSRARPIGTNTTGQEAEGPHCVGGGALSDYAARASLLLLRTCLPATGQPDGYGEVTADALITHRDRHNDQGDRRRHRRHRDRLRRLPRRQPARRRKEVGSEIELAANRKPYYDDEELEGPRSTGRWSSASACSR